MFRYERDTLQIQLDETIESRDLFQSQLSSSIENNQNLLAENIDIKKSIAYSTYN